MGKFVVPMLISLVCGTSLIGGKELLKEMDKLNQKKGGEKSEAMTKLGEKVRHYSEETVTSAFVTATTHEQRLSLLDVVAIANSSDGRYLPLLLTTVQFSRDPRERREAARVLGGMKNLRGPFRESAVAYALGDALSRESDQNAAEGIAFWLQRFMRKSCQVDIGALEPTDTQPPPIDEKQVPVGVVKVAAVREWWEKEGRGRALAKEFDRGGKE